MFSIAISHLNSRIGALMLLNFLMLPRLESWTNLRNLSQIIWLQCQNEWISWFCGSIVIKRAKIFAMKFWIFARKTFRNREEPSAFLEPNFHLLPTRISSKLSAILDTNPTSTSLYQLMLAKFLISKLECHFRAIKLSPCKSVCEGVLES